MMSSLTDILYDYLMQTEYEALQADEAYQREKDARDALERAFLETLTPQQRRVFNLYEEQEGVLASLEGQHRFTGTLALVRQLRAL